MAYSQEQPDTSWSGLNQHGVQALREARFADAGKLVEQAMQAAA